MTGEEMERAIEFLLQGQANHQVRLDELTEKLNQLTRRVDETNRIVQFHAETQSQFIEIVTRTMEGLAAMQEQTHREIVESNARTDQLIAESNTRTDQLIAESNARTDQLIAESSARTDQLIAESRARGAETDARLDRLAALVERNITGGNGNS